ncbi:MAG: type II secretion system F family protein [Armatimonadetes bacterium]|nr:type II secretion system F family protein [Armatimonadota bacterium]MDW8028369.1 type II secretion system F family protein [Armatimonadota bacterium]
MPVYEWQGRDLSGQPQRGAIYAETTAEAQERLRERGIQPTLLRPVQQKTRVSWWARTVGLRPSVLAQFFHDLHQSVRAGVPLRDALETIARMPTPLSPVAQHSAKRISAGVPLSQSLAETGVAFPPYVIPMIQAGEQSGRLDEALGYLADFFQREHRTWLITWGALMGCFGCYTVGCVVPVALLIIFALPKIITLVSRDPQWSLGLYQQMFGPVKYVLLGILVFFALYLLNWLLSRNPKLALWWDGIKMKLPLVGLPQQRNAVARFGRVLSMLYSAGIPPTESLILAGQASGSLSMARAARQQATRLKQGAKFSEAIASVPFISPTVIQAVAIGERTGNLDEGLKRVAEMLEQEAQAVQTAKPFALGAFYYALIAAALIFLVMWAWRAFSRLYEIALQWTEVP